MNNYEEITSVAFATFRRSCETATEEQESHQVEALALKAPEMLGTLETLLAGLQEGEDIGSLLNYINIQVRAVVEQAGGKVPPPADCSPYLKKVAAVEQLIEALKECQYALQKLADITTENRAGWALKKTDTALKNAGVGS